METITIPFKPGAFTKGQQVTFNGVTYTAKVDMKNARATPANNAYWSSSVAKPLPVVTKEQLLKESNSPEQNSTAWENFHNSITAGHAPLVEIPRGDYHFARDFIIDSRPMNLRGASGSVWAFGTRFFFPDGSNGVLSLRTLGYQGAVIENIQAIAKGNTIEWKSGMMARARTSFINCSARGFSHNGFDFWCNMEGEGTDGSGSLVSNCVSLENKHDGYFAGRLDANCITFFNCDSRDNGRYGFNDDSFLGNNYIVCMNHYNKAGDFHVRDWGNARSLFQGCYTEGGNTPSSLGPLCSVIGGLWGTGYKIGSDPKIRTGAYIPNLNQ